jgi:hypothetical protein
MSERRIALVAWLVVSILWVGALGVWFWSAWPNHVAPVEAQFVGREGFCGARYDDPAARERCVIIMDLERFQARSIMMFNRGLALLGPPLIGLGLIHYLRRPRMPRPRPPAGNRRR